MQLAVHFTAVYRRCDTRIQVKRFMTLYRPLDPRVRLLVQGGLGDETDLAGFEIHDISGPYRGRLNRVLRSSWRMYRALRRLGLNIAHFHNPELLTWPLLLRLGGTKVVCGLHEDAMPKPVARLLDSLLASELPALAQHHGTGAMRSSGRFAGRHAADGRPRPGSDQNPLKLGNRLAAAVLVLRTAADAADSKLLRPVVRSSQCATGRGTR